MSPWSAQLLVTPEQLDAGEVEIDGDRYRHLFRARRLEVGELVRVVDGAGRARNGRVSEVDRTSARFALEGPLVDGSEPAIELVLAVATLRMERSAWLVEKATEVGVSEIAWFNSKRAPRRYRAAQLERLVRVARAAVEQCGRSRLPKVRLHNDWESLLTEVPGRRSLLLDPAAEMLLSEDLHQLPAAPPGQIIVGPEGGFARDEISELCGAGARRRSLGERILRAETAAVVASGLILC